MNGGFIGIDMEIYKTYPHNPPHFFSPNAFYMVTASTTGRSPVLDSDEKKRFFCETLFSRAEQLDWSMEAWAVMTNHYHFIARAPENADSLSLLIRGVHSITAIQLNLLDQTPGRKVWSNYWDSCLTYESSYYARLHYVHMNPVKHGLVEFADEYEFCSFRWFLEQADASFVQKILQQPVDKLQIIDDF